NLLTWVDYTLTCTGAGSPPSGRNWNLILNGTCQRDQYVGAAISYAWAAAAYAYQGNQTRATENAENMRTQLRNADRLCSDAPYVAPGTTCVTAQIYDCGPNGRPGPATSQGCA